MNNQLDNGSFEVDQGVAFYQKQDYATAFNCFLAAANKGNLIGMNNLSFFFANGIGTPKNEVAAFEWMKRAAENGYVPAYYPLASKYYTGSGVAKNMVQAKIWAEKTIQFGNDQEKQNAKMMVGEILKVQNRQNLGLGVFEIKRGLCCYNQKDYGQAYQFFKEAVDKGNYEGMHNISLMYLKGEGFPVDLEQSFKCMKEAAEHGVAGSFYPLAAKYYFGKGTPKNYEQAEVWARKILSSSASAKDKENAKVMITELERIKKTNAPNPNTMTFSPEIVKEFSEACTLYNSSQYELALEKFEKIGKLGHPGALRVIGQAYLDGKGVEVNVSNGYQFLREAAFRGDELAIKFIAKRLINRPQFGVWKAYAQNLNLKECEETLTQGIIHERNRTDTYVNSYDAREAMIKAAECWKDYKFHPRTSTRSVDTGAFGAYCYYQKAACYGNVEGLCGIAMYENEVNAEKYKMERMELYRVAAYCGHSLSMYRTAQYYDAINRKAADACYLQAARWGYQPARYVCDQRGLII